MPRTSVTASAILCTLLVIGSGCALETTSDDFGASASALASPECVVSLHAILEDAGEVVGEIQFRLRPMDDGSGDALISYDGVYVPRDPDFTYSSIGVSVRSRFDDASIFDSFVKSETGSPSSSTIQFSQLGVLDGHLAGPLVDAPTNYRGVFNVVSTTGGKEAEGLLEPDRSAPETLRDRQRTCF